MNITTKYDIGQKVWTIGTYDVRPKKCSECGNLIRIIRYRVLPKSKIIRVSVETSMLRGNIIRYLNNKQNHAQEIEIDCEGGIWFTSPEFAQLECDRRNAERKKIKKER